MINVSTSDREGLVRGRNRASRFCKTVNKTTETYQKQRNSLFKLTNDREPEAKRGGLVEPSVPKFWATCYNFGARYLSA